MAEEEFEKQIKDTFDAYDELDVDGLTVSEQMSQIIDLMRFIFHLDWKIPKDTEWKEAFLQKWTAQYSKRLLILLMREK
jgi:hypothetical protein